jgi:hypothetical protein
MKYIKTYEYNEMKISPEEKQGNEAASKIQSLINKLLNLKRDNEIVDVHYYLFWPNYKTSTYLMITMENFKNIPKSNFIIDELVRLKCQDYLEKHTEPYETRNKRVFLLTIQQYEELLISFKNGLPHKKIRIYKDKIYTYKKFKFKNSLYPDDVIIGKMSELHKNNLHIQGYNLNDKPDAKNIRNSYNDETKYIRYSTPEEIEYYELMDNANKYNL